MEIVIEKHWFALKVFFNKVFEVESELKTFNIESYCPVTWVEKWAAGKRTMVRKPAISSLLFFRSSVVEASDVEARLKGRVMLYKTSDTKQPAVIPDHEMNVFKIVTSSGEDGLEYLDVNAANYTVGERVEVIDGPFKGAEGYIKRIKGNRRLVVTIEGVVAVATTYIPSSFLRKINGE